YRRIGGLHVIGERREPRFATQLRLGPGAESADSRRRRILQEALQQLGIGHLHGVQALAQHRLHRGLPSLLDAELLPKPGPRRQLVPLDPVVDLAVLLDLALDLLERGELPLEQRQLALQRLQGLGARSAPLLDVRPGVLELVEQGFLARQLGAALRELPAQPLHRLSVGRGQLCLLGEELLAALLERLQRLVRVCEVRLLDLEGLLRLRDALAFAGDAAHQQPHRLLDLRELRLLLGEPAPRLLPPVARFLAARFPAGQGLALVELALLARVALAADLRELGFEPLPRVGDEADLGLEARHLGVRAVELALRCGQCVPGGVVLRAGLLELALALAHARVLRLQLDPGALDVARVALRLGLRLVAPEQPQQVLLLGSVRLQLVVTAGGPRPPSPPPPLPIPPPPALPLPGRGSRGCRRGGARSRACAPCTWIRPPPPRGTRAAPRAAPR